MPVASTPPPRSRATSASTGGTPRWVPRTTRRAHQAAIRRATRWRRARASLLIGAVVLALVADAPSATLAACEGTDARASVLAVGLDPDGEPRRVEQQLVGRDGDRCVLPEGAPATGEAVRDRAGVGVAIDYRDAGGRSLESGELSRATDAIRTRVAVRDRSAVERELTVTGPDGALETSRRVGIPRMVHVEVRFPRGWEVGHVVDDGVGVRVEDGATILARSELLFVPFTPEQVQVRAEVLPGRGAPEVAVTTTLLAGPEAYVVPDELLDEDTAAVLGAINAVALRASGQLVEAIEELADGSAELTDGVGQLAGGAEQAAAGVGELAQGTEELAGGAGALASGVDELADGGAVLQGGTGELAAGTRELAVGADALAAGADEVAAGARGLADELAVLGQAPEAVPDDPGPLIDAVGELEAGTRALGQQLAVARDELSAAVPEGTDPTDPSDPGAPLAAAVEALDAAAQGAQALAAGTEQLAAGLVEALSGLQGVADDLAALAEGTAELADGSEQVAGGAGELALGLSQLAAGADDLADGTRSLAGGLDELRGGAAELAGGAGELAGGTAAAAEGLDELADGGRELESGASELASGTRTLADGSDALPDAFEETVGIADRGVQRTALANAMIDDGVQRAKDELGDATSLTATLVASGSEPVPWGWILGGAAAFGFALAAGWGLRSVLETRRRRPGVGRAEAA